MPHHYLQNLSECFSDIPNKSFNAANFNRRGTHVPWQALCSITGLGGKGSACWDDWLLRRSIQWCQKHLAHYTGNIWGPMSISCQCHQGATICQHSHNASRTSSTEAAASRLTTQTTALVRRNRMTVGSLLETVCGGEDPDRRK